MSLTASYLLAPANQGLIIMAIIGLLLMILAILTGFAPDLMEGESTTVPLLRIPVFGLLLALVGVGSAPILFLLGIYPFMIGMIGWGGNLWWHWQYGLYPNVTESFIIKGVGLMLARLLVGIFAHFKPLLKTHTTAEQLIPERFIGCKGKVLSVLGEELMEINVYDTVGQYSVQIYGLPWENASDRHFQVGDQVYILGLVSPRRYAVVKADSYDEMKAIKDNPLI
ncbi:hypothetical protein [Crocosphaera sp. XPORK-15E]|uniref:hypothetical protein n=1 Tax=Crocosphaera sp. XPORK-15E TaxID=3110247 RepID=UPI002B212FCC|nr:hypothetical protein [Crocosphaera sp. XPORK-15E]MEA5535420.1 hypothetical protein [Crocosphaera sp. XPORK-15E]